MKLNKYSVFIFLLSMCTCFGALGGAFQVDRILAVLLSPWLFTNLSEKGCGYARHLINILILFYAYMAFSYIWTPDKQEALKQLMYYPIHFLLFVELIVFARFANNPLRNISLGWMIAVLLCSAVAYWEITTNQHLSIAKEQADLMNLGTVILQHYTASATFYNYNSYVTFLCFSFPWIFYIMIDSKSKFFMRLLSLAVMIMASLVIIINASRGGVLSILVMIVVYWCFSQKTSFKNIIILALILLMGYTLLRYGESVTEVIFARTANGGMYTDEGRFSIWSDALKVLSDSYGFGVGLGGLHVAMEKYATLDVLSVHNMFLEILVQYGFIITIVVVAFLIKLLKKSFNIERDRKNILLMALISMPLYTIIDSGYLLSTHLWVLMATIYVFVNLERIKSHMFMDKKAVGRIQLA